MKRAASLAGAMILAAAMGATGAQAKQDILIGHISIMTGPGASYGQTQKVAVDLAVEDVNAAGGINGSKLVVRTEDAQFDPGQAVLLFRKLRDQGAVAVIGPISGTQWETVSPLANQLKLPAIAVNASKPGITIKPWTLRLTPADDTLIPDGVEAFRRQNPQAKTAVVVADVREASGKAGADMFRQYAEKSGLKVLDTVEFSTKATDLSPVAIKLRELNPDAVFVVALPAQAITLAREFEAQKVTAPVLANSMIWPTSFVSMIPDISARWHTIGFSTNSRINGDEALYASVFKRYAERVDLAYGNPPNIANNTIAYDAVILLAEIMKKRGIDGDTAPDKARTMIMENLSTLKTFARLNRYTIRDTGDGYIAADILKVDGARRVWAFTTER
jgi:branched-chain amino acid transport system substrate-binding protein